MPERDEPGAAPGERRGQAPTGARPRTVLVPLDGTGPSERAVPTALALATALGAPIELVNVTWNEPATQEATYLDEIAAELAGVEVTTRVEHGLPGPALADVIAGTDDAIVCVATRGHGGVAGAVLGSVVDELLREVLAPFALVGPEIDAGRTPTVEGPLVLCFDGSDDAAAVVPLARVLADALSKEIRVTMVLHHHGDYLGNEMATSAKERARTLVDGLTGDGFRASLDLLDGLEPGHAIVEHAEAVAAALVVMATHGSRGVLRGILGSTAERVARHAPCPVVVQRPR